MKLLAAAVVAVLLVPAAARAEATLVERDVPLGAAAALAAAAPNHFDLVGLHWRGPGTVRFRTRSARGAWSAWRAAAPEGEDLPNGDTDEARRSHGWRLGNPWWTGPSDRIQYRLVGRVRRLRAYFVSSPDERLPTRTLTMAGSPAIVPRLSWSANERIRRAPPVYADALRFAIVHHTAGSNRYSPSQSAAIVRAIELYHVLGNGWNDIGYNFLVDKYGHVFEGRYGGVDRNVVGAHAQGFNTGSVGVALLGNYDSARPTAAAEAAIESLLAWRLDVAHIDPVSTLTFASGGNPRYPTGSPVFLRAISGHRDTGFTSCPGRTLYARIGAIAQATLRLGLPKLYQPSVSGKVGKAVRFRARLSTALPWSVTVADPEGNVVASGVGTGKAVDWTWDASLAFPGAYSYAFTAGTDVRPAVGTFGGSPPPLRLSGLTATPAVVTPNGDGIDDVSTISYTLSVPATLSATLVDVSGVTLARLFTDLKPAGRQIFTFAAEGVPDGTYRIVLSAQDARGKKASASVAVTVTRVQAANAGGPR
jgi:N-acetylmuramoyl-L-alanine amidase